MRLNRKLLEDFQNSESKLLAVTKYWNPEETADLLSQFGEKGEELLVGIGENRVESLQEKDCEREAVHFIGNVQTKEIKHILTYCGTIHSLDNIKQIRKIDSICEKQSNWVKVFIQVNLDPEKAGGISQEKIPEFMAAIDECENISLIGFSGIGKAECTEEERREDFQLLKALKARYLPNGIISAGTSRDYKIAIEEEIDIIRVGKSLVDFT